MCTQFNFRNYHVVWLQLRALLRIRHGRKLMKYEKSFLSLANTFSRSRSLSLSVFWIVLRNLVVVFIFHSNRFQFGCCCWCYFGMSNRLPLNALSRDLIKMCQSMAIITQQLDKHLPIEYFNECLLRLTISPDAICLPSFILCNLMYLCTKSASVLSNQF